MRLALRETGVFFVVDLEAILLPSHASKNLIRVAVPGGAFGWF
jgi:hypothetical protein